MALELLDESQKSKSKFDKKEHKWKELLYNLFYEIKSEIINSKIEIEEDEYQENINSTTIPQLVNYIHDSIQILLKKKIEDTKEEQKELDKKFYLNTNLISCEDNKEKKFQNFFEYENIIRNLESKQRILTKNYFQQKLQIDAMENKIEEYMEMEDEFEEMKTKLKYEDGRFLNNDRKDHEIIIIRNENSKLKNTVDELEKENNKLQNLITEQNKKINSLKEEIEKLNKRNNQMNKFLLENEDNNNNNLNLTERYTKNHISNYLNIISDNKEIRDKNNTLKYYKYQRMNLQSTHYNKIKKKIYSKKKSEGNKTSNNNEKKSTKENTNANLNSNDLLSTTRNEYTQKLKPKLNKYFSGNNINRIGTKSCNKKNKNSVNQYLPMNNSHIGYRKYTHLFSGNKNNKINNLYSVKKIIANSALKGLRPNSSTKISNKYRGFIYKSASGDN